MKERLSALYLDCKRAGPPNFLVDTVLRGVLGYKDGDRIPRLLRNNARLQALFAELRDPYAPLSYSADWREAFIDSPDLTVEVCYIHDLLHFKLCLLRLRQYDLIVISHVAAGDDMSLLLRYAHRFDRRRAPLVMFIGNEYDLLDEKIGFIRDVEAEFVCSQLSIAAAHVLYQECEGTRILELPHALNPKQYFPVPNIPRQVDIGFIGDIYWPFVGDRERTDLIEWFEHHGSSRGLRCDIRKERVPREAWGRFLSGCKAIIGAESGTYYLGDRGCLLARARAYNLLENQAADFDEVFNRFYRGEERTAAGKCISSRHFEPIGTKTCQMLVEGHYNGILKVDRNYIAINKNLTNIDEAIERFRDEAYRTRMVEETYDYVLSEHTYAHRVERLLRIVTSTAQAEGSTQRAPSASVSEGA
jgi:hypothetical protein